MFTNNIGSTAGVSGGTRLEVLPEGCEQMTAGELKAKIEKDASEEVREGFGLAN
ncbi:MAG: hypothetical protein OXC91_02895 [Rhodobacteraceae bacterium]|nr:hypothetical protein [Paracoccaceae bacterium]